METELDQEIKTLDIPIVHSFTMEKIYHFVCGECKNWWSHATTRLITNIILQLNNCSIYILNRANFL